MSRNNKNRCTMDINQSFFKKITTTKSLGIRPREGKKRENTNDQNQEQKEIL